ncbi:HEAT repeat domain-containing protein [Streptomyces akebiae]|uniref:Ankyrin repeat domain-containing protein n=1 Tax=Streptomyces akebiae TaxID=2865673 RepID=A0ABX8XPE3_9ACTN|nr:HEAT repeat domain-containing protein [Streptomyces akebiae]QYX77768.1 ankyrin repeat domain-containing protein [Streptomyces akebiae]
MEPLGRAARDDDEESVRALLDGGADVNGRSPGGLTALMLAAGAGAHHAADALRENGAYVALRDEHGRSALDFAEEGAERHPEEPGYLMIVTDLEKYFGRRADFATTMERAIRFGDPESDIWFRAISALDGWADDEAVAGAEVALNSPRASERYFAADLLRSFRLYNASLRNGAHRTRQAAALLRARLAVEDHPAVLGLVIQGLVEQSGFADDAREILRHAGHPHREVRAAVAYAVYVSQDVSPDVSPDLGGREARTTLEALLALARDPCAEVRGHAVASLSCLFDPAEPVPAVHTALRRALHDPDPSVVHDAACALGKLDSGRRLPFRAEQILVRRYLDEPGESRYYARAFRVIERWPRERLWDVRDSLPE